jgi:hypothetical protein
MDIEKSNKVENKKSLLYNFNRKSNNPFSTAFNSLKICTDC